jgi:hypothetical protein
VQVRDVELAAGRMRQQLVVLLEDLVHTLQGSGISRVRFEIEYNDTVWFDVDKMHTCVPSEIVCGGVLQKSCRHCC